MKYNWGHGLATAIILGIIALSSLVFVVTKERIDMVTDEYYPKELNYQDQINKIKTYTELEKGIELKVNGELLIQFPEVVANPGDITGALHIYRPSDKRLDIERELRLTEAYTMVVDRNLLKAGKYEVIIDWKAGDQSYLTKLPLFIQ